MGVAVIAAAAVAVSRHGIERAGACRPSSGVCQLREGHPAGDGGELPHLSRRGHAARQARPAFARGGYSRRRPRHGARAGQRGSEQVVPDDRRPRSSRPCRWASIRSRRAQIAAFRGWINQGAQWDAPVSFAKDIQPIMERSCWTCHGATMQLSKLDLRTRESARCAAARTAPALVPGNAEQSRLYRAVAHLERSRCRCRATPLDAGGDRRDEELDRSGRAVGRGAATSATAERPASSALAALESMAITPEERNYWAFKLPVQAPLPRRGQQGPHASDRSLPREGARRAQADGRAARRPAARWCAAPISICSACRRRPAQVARFVADDTARRVGAADRHAARLAALRRALRPPLARRGALRRLRRLRVRRPSPQRLALSRLRHPVVQRRQAVRPLPHRADRRRRDGLARPHDSLIATGFLRAGPRVLFREKDNPERRFDYLDDDARHDRQGHARADGQLRALPRPQVRSDPRRRTTTRCRRRSSATSRPRCRWRRAPRPRPTWRRTRRSTPGATTLRSEDRRHREAAPRSAGARADQDRFSDAHLPGRRQARSERTPGEKLLAIQVFEAVNVLAGRDRQGCWRPTSSREEGADRRRSRRSRSERPAPLPMAEIATDGDHRFSPLGEGDEVVSCPKCRIPPPFPGSYLHKGRDATRCRPRTS